MVDIKPYINRLIGSNVIFAGLVGLVVGLVGWLLNMFFRQAVVVPLFCNSPDSFGVCNNGGTYTWWAATVILTVASLFVMVRRNVYRPLLVVMAVIASLWGSWLWLGYLEWWHATLWQGVLFGLGYALFTLIARIANFGISLGVMVAVVIALRLISLSA